MLKTIIPYGRQSIDADDIRAVVKVLKGDWLTQGPAISAFEESLCRYTGARFAVAVANGTTALHLAYLAAGLKKGDEAITSPLTFAATANAVLYVGAKVIFADVNDTTGNIDPKAIAQNINAKTKVIVPVHFGGRPCDLPTIYNLAKKKNILVIEDACHALGASYEYKGKKFKIGSCRHSDMAVFSFHPVKSIATGEGGAIVTNNEQFYKKLLKLRTHGITKDVAEFVTNKDRHGPWYYEMQELGFNFRITDMQCALGVSQLKKLDTFIERRSAIVAKYKKAWINNAVFNIPPDEKHCKSAWHLFPIVLKSNLTKYRRDLFILLRKLGLGVQVHYIPVHLQPYYTKLGYKQGLCPKAEAFYAGEISLPIFPGMSDGEVKQVITVVNQATKQIFK